MLTLDGVTCGYGGAPVLHALSLEVHSGRVLTLLGRNGAGKTTTLRAIIGLVRTRSGSIRLDGEELAALRPHAIPRRGVAYVPQGRGLFPSLTVEENLRMGLLVKGSHPAVLESVFDMLPVLKDRLKQRAGTLSGGEQQMVATARALCAEPRYLLLDEPTEGLMPALVQKVLETVQILRMQGVGILLVEQKVDAALKVADTVVVLETGYVRYRGTPDNLAQNPEVLPMYLGVRRTTDSAR